MLSGSMGTVEKKAVFMMELLPNNKKKVKKKKI
jgi:hypothetical protein